jgi:integrase
MSQLPKRWRQAYRGKTASEVLGETEGTDIARIEPATFNKEMGLIKAFWRWACIREELTRNAMDAVKPMEAGSAKDKRKPFSDDEIRMLARVIETQRTVQPERYWVPLLLAYTGARLEEIAQLRKEDVFLSDGVWCIRITADAGSVKTDTSERDLPLHSAVIAKGFLDYVNAQSGERLFSGGSREGGIGQPISKWFGRQVTNLGIPDRTKKTLHSFRHTMRDKLRLAGVDAVTRREILGHAHEDVEDQVYGDPTGIKERKVAIEKIRLPI